MMKLLSVKEREKGKGKKGKRDKQGMTGGAGPLRPELRL
jgi:hypothetical protein